MQRYLVKNIILNIFTFNALLLLISNRPGSSDLQN